MTQLLFRLNFLIRNVKVLIYDQLSLMEKHRLRPEFKENILFNIGGADRVSQILKR